jgi:hypothetical protein
MLASSRRWGTNVPPPIWVERRPREVQAARPVTEPEAVPVFGGVISAPAGSWLVTYSDLAVEVVAAESFRARFSDVSQPEPEAVVIDVNEVWARAAPAPAEGSSGEAVDSALERGADAYTLRTQERQRATLRDAQKDWTNPVLPQGPLAPG